MKKIIAVLLSLVLWCGPETHCQDAIETNISKEAIIKKFFDSSERVRFIDDGEPRSRNNKKAYKIRVYNQATFDESKRLIKSALQAGVKNIIVKIKRGVYYFDDGQMSLAGYQCPETDIVFQGKGVTIVPKGYLLYNGSTIPCEVGGESCFVNITKKRTLQTWGDMMYADSLVEVVDLAAKQCRLKCSALGDLKVPEGNMAYLNLTRWCRCYQYKVLRIENGYVYFYAHDLAKDNIFNKPEYNVNYDYIFAKVNPRFRLCNISTKEELSAINGKVHLANCFQKVHLCKTSSFMALYNSSFHSLTIKGITFLGSKQSSMPLFYFRDVKANKIEFYDCRFIGQRGKIMNLYSTGNLVFRKNYVTDNYDWGIELDNMSPNARITENYFENNGTNMSYNRCVTCGGENYYIAKNTFKNFGYCAISVGVWYGAEMVNPSSGIVEYNHIFYSDDYFAEPWKHTIMDSGAIYAWTQNSDAIIRYNYIHDYTGMEQNRGIFCDDGAHHLTIYGNLIMNIPNCHAIDSRRVAVTETARNKLSKSTHNNIKNVVMYNLTDGTINFVGNEVVDNGCLEGMNILLRHSGKRLSAYKYKPELKSIQIKADDIELDYINHDEKGIMISSEGVNEIKQMPCYEKIKKWVRTGL